MVGRKEGSMPLCVRMVLEALLLARNLLLCFVHMLGLAVEARWSTSIIACFEGCVLMVHNRRVCSMLAHLRAACVGWSFQRPLQVVVLFPVYASDVAKTGPGSGRLQCLISVVWWCCLTHLGRSVALCTGIPLEKCALVITAMMMMMMMMMMMIARQPAGLVAQSYHNTACC